MIRKSLLFVSILVAGIKCDAGYKKNYELNIDLERAFDFLKEIKSDYSSGDSLSEDALVKVDREITEYVRNSSSAVSNRRKRHSTYRYSNEGIDVFDGFADFGRFDHDGTRDMELFSLGYELEEAAWFAAVLDDQKVSVHRITINDGSLKGVAGYPVANGTRLIVNGCTCGALLIIEHQNGSVLVLSFTRGPNDDYALQANDQDLGLNSTTDLAIWNGIGMNQLYLGVATRDNVSVYTWFGKYFDPTQVIDQRAERLIPFRSKGSMHLAVITADSTATLIFRHFLESNEFLLVQRLPPSREASFFEFQFQHGRFADRFLCLSTGSSGIVYKQTYDRFVPFQRIPLQARIMVPIVSMPRKAILLFGIQEAAITAYQYDGWRFVPTNSSGMTLAVDHFRPVYLQGNELLLLIKSKEDGRWTLKRPVWVRKNSYESIQDEAKRWIVEAKSRARRTIDIANPRQPIEISNGSIDLLRVTNINGYDTQKLINITRKYGKLISRLDQRSRIDDPPKKTRTLTIDSIRAKRIRAKCKSNCKANRLYGGNLRRIEQMSKPQMSKTSSSKYYRLLNVGEVKDWKCPFVSLPMDDVNVSESLNGVSLNDLQNRTLKVTGNQEVSGKHQFASLTAREVVAPLNIAANFTSQRLIMKTVAAKRLQLTTGGILLPLNGNSSTITGSIETSVLRVKNIHLKGKPTGDGMRRLRPVTFIDETMFLNGNFTVENVKIENLAAAGLIDEKAGPVETVLKNAIPLRGEYMPVSLILSSQRTKWSNVIYGGPWVAQNSSLNAISGKKHFLRDVEVTKFSRDSCLPKIQSNLCGNYVIAPQIDTRILKITNCTVKNVNSTQAFGTLGERSVSSFDPVFPGPEYRRRNVNATNVFAIRSNGGIEKLKKLGGLQFDRDSLVVDAFNATELTGNSLLPPVRLDVGLSAERIRARKMISKKNSTVRLVNGVDLNDFSANAIKIGRMISLANVKFRNGFSVGCVQAFHPPPYLNGIATSGVRYHLGRKQIFGRVETDAMYAPAGAFEIPRNEQPINMIVEGSTRFSREPRIKAVNDVPLEEIFRKIWLATEDAVFHGMNLHFRDAIRLGNVTVVPPGTMHPESWRNVSRRVLSKTRPQEIFVDAFLKDITVQTVEGSNGSTIKCLLTDFGDTFENSLLKNEDREIRARWTFEEINITEGLYVGNAINHLDLGRDVARHDLKDNVFSGKKTVLTVTAENFDGYNFQEWFANVFETKRATMIDGKKMFKGSAYFDAGVTVTGSPDIVDSLLLKSTDQTIHGRKEIRGFIDASELVVNGLVNDVNLTELTNRQLKKRVDDNRPRRIRTSIEFRNSFNVDGSLAINGTYANAETSTLYANYSNEASPIVQAIEKFSLVAEAVLAALINRAMYLNKLEIVKDATSIDGLPTIERMHCGSTHFSPRCIGKPITDLGLPMNTSDDFVLLRSVVIDEEELIVLVKHDSVSIFPSVSPRAPVLDLHISRIMDAFLEETRRSLWIVLRLSSHALLLRYRPSRQVLESYVLPGTNAYATNRAPNLGQLLLISSDGLWNLGGLATPRNIVRIPLEEIMEMRVSKFDYYLKSITPGNRTTVMKARYATRVN